MFFRRKSPENTTNNAEQAPNGSSAETEYPAFDPEAAKRARQERARETTIGEELEPTPTPDPEPTPTPDPEPTPTPEAPIPTPEAPIPAPETPTPVPETPQISELEEYTPVRHNHTAQEQADAAEIPIDIDPDMIESTLGDLNIEDSNTISTEYDMTIPKDVNTLSEQSRQPVTSGNTPSSPEPQASMSQDVANVETEYKEAYPNAIINKDKAHFMALAEDPYRTNAIKERANEKAAVKEIENAFLEAHRQTAAGNERAAQASIKKKDDAFMKQFKARDNARAQDEKARDAGDEAGLVYDISRPY